MDSVVAANRAGYRSALIVVGWLCFGLCGCGPNAERSNEAVSLPTVARDPREDVAADQNWPGWRGVNTSGVSPDRDLPVAWTAENGIRWKQPVPGRGNSSPVVWGDHVLVTSALGGEGGRLVVHSFDRQSGKNRWSQEAGSARGDTHNKNGYASASVVTDGKQVFASFGSAGLFAFELESGRRQWRAELGELDHEWGTASSPVLARDCVIQLCDSDRQSDLRAFDKATGKPVWRTPRTSSGSWSTPVLVEVAGEAGPKRSELVVNGTGVDGAKGYVIAYDPTHGRELWRVEGTTDTVCPTAIVGGGLVISTSGRNGPIIAIKPGGAGDVTKTHVVWKHFRGGPYVPTGVAYRNRLYTVADGGVMQCYNLGSGENVWRDRLRGNFTASLIAGDGHIYAASEQGVVYVVTADDEFQLLATNDMQERILATPAVAQGDLFLRTETLLYCVAAQAKPDQSEPRLAQDAAKD